MKTIGILSSSVRTGRNSHRVAQFFEAYIRSRNLAQTDMIDLNAYQFPLFEERLRFMQNPPAAVTEFASRIRSADGILIVTPEYNGGYPAALKNAVDLLFDEWYRKPVALAAVSEGAFGGSQVLTSLSFSLWKLRAILVPASFQVAQVRNNYAEDGTPADKEGVEKRAAKFLDELLWTVNAVSAK